MPIYGRSAANIIFLVDRVEKAQDKREEEREKWQKKIGNAKKERVYKKRRLSIPDSQSLLTLNLIP
ncbi:hypothetical protein F030043B2_08580 [Bacteroides fragilis]